MSAKEDIATALVRAVQASPWFGVIGLTVAVTIFGVRRDSRLEAAEHGIVHAQATADTAKGMYVGLMDSVREVQKGVDRIGLTTNSILCALDPEQTAAVDRCREYRINQTKRRIPR
jgi:hypothetical protein